MTRRGSEVHVAISCDRVPWHATALKQQEPERECCGPWPSFADFSSHRNASVTSGSTPFP